jgi:hypothetical protein
LAGISSSAIACKSAFFFWNSSYSFFFISSGVNLPLFPPPCI